MKMEPFQNKIWLASPTMHGEELTYMQEAYNTNWMSTMGRNINEIERALAERIGCARGVALSSGTAALHLAIKLAGVKPGDLVFCSDLTFSATVNPVAYEGGIPVLIDSEYDTWNMDPAALEKAFALYPETRVVVAVNLYGTPAKLRELREICDCHDAVLIEDAAESLGAGYLGRQTGSFGHLNIISFNGNKIITGSSGGMLLTDREEYADKTKKWSTQSREPVSWYQHTELGYNYRMSNVIAGVVRGQLLHLEEHIARKRAIYERYHEGLKDLPIRMNPYERDTMEPNFWLSCMLIDEAAMGPQERTDTAASYKKVPGKTCPTEILEKLAACNAEGRPIWKPMHLQPVFASSPFVSVRETPVVDDLFARGLCLPSDIKMTEKEQDQIIAIIRSCFAM